MTTSLPSSGHEHDPALAALLFLPVAVVLVFVAIEAFHGLGVAPASRMRAGYESLGARTKAALLLVAMTAWVHLALVPSHVAEDPLRAALFAGDGVALGVTAFLALARVTWRPFALLLLGGSLAAYAFYVVTGREGLDAVGIFTKAIEAVAIALVISGRRADQPLTPSTPGPARTSNPTEVPTR